MSHRTTPTPCSTKFCVGWIGGNAVYQNEWESNTKTNSLTENSNIWTSSLQVHHPFQQDSLEEKKTQTTHNQHAEFHMDTNKAAEDIVTLACVKARILYFKQFSAPS